MTTAERPRQILLVNGPNLNLLGVREPEIYGHDTLEDVVAMTTEAAARHGLGVRHVQSNHEGELIDAIQAARLDCIGVVINPAGFTGTSVALRDALLGVSLPVVEVHLSNIHRREEFRRHSYISGIADVVVCGAGIYGYPFAVEHLARAHA